VPLDGSGLAEAALPLAARWAETLQAQLHLVRAVAMPVLSDGFESRVSYTPDLLDTMLEEAKGYLSGTAGRLESATHTIVEVLIGPAAFALQDYVAAQSIDLVIMTSHGRSGILRSALGSVTDRLLGSTAPVMVVPCVALTEAQGPPDLHGSVGKTAPAELSERRVERATMAFIRISLMTPRSGQQEELEKLLDSLVAYLHGKPGFIAAYRLSPDPHSMDNRVGRISIWESEDDANRMSSDQHDQALQAEIKLVAIDATHEENSFSATVPDGKSALTND
jgi:nucleotide-binding universal stress UspA family protein/heme-degrading monooxygenase HmoA